MLTAAQILWEGAGRPEVDDTEPASGPCWWCAGPIQGKGRLVASLPATFPTPPRVGCPTSKHLCSPCAFTVSDHVRLPPKIAGARLAMKARAGRRALVTIPELGPGKRLLLTLSDGRIGTWDSPQGVSTLDGAEFTLDDLRQNPRDVRGLYKGRKAGADSLCKFLGAWDPALVSEGGEDGAEKFRAYHHYGTQAEWVPCTDTQKSDIRDFLLNPPSRPWVCAIGDGKKHHVLFTRPAHGGSRATMRLRDAQIDYDPEVLALGVASAKALAEAGAGEEDLLAGAYTSRPSLELLRAVREHDGALRPFRGSPVMDLILYLHKAKEIADVDATES